MTYTEPLFAIFAVAALIGAFRKRRWLTIAGMLGLLAITHPTVEWLLSRPLESAYPVRPFEKTGDIQAVVVFSGGVNPAVFERPFPQTNQDTMERCAYAAWIYRCKPVPILACAGASSGRGPAFSSAMRELLRAGGVPDNMIWTEDKSRDTHENATYGSEVLRQHQIDRVALVVDARSMIRAAACLRKQGIQVVEAPSRFRTWGPVKDEVLPSWKGLKGNEETLHEMLGLFWYRLRGWI